jgi:hypothetical protein
MERSVLHVVSAVLSGNEPERVEEQRAVEAKRLFVWDFTQDPA